MASFNSACERFVDYSLILLIVCEKRLLDIRTRAPFTFALRLITTGHRCFFKQRPSFEIGHGGCGGFVYSCLGFLFALSPPMSCLVILLTTQKQANPGLLSTVLGLKTAAKPIPRSSFYLAKSFDISDGHERINEIHNFVFGKIR